MKYLFDTILSKAYWQYVLFSKTGIQSILTLFGFFYLLIESLDFFNIYTRDEYASYAFIIFWLLAVIISIIFKRPIKSILIPIAQKDSNIEVRIADLFDASGSIVISSNTYFEADVAGGKIATDSLQGQFTAKFFTGNQNELIKLLELEIKKLSGNAPYPMGTTRPISTHGKTFYFTVMAEINEHGNAHTTLENIRKALDGLWKYVVETGELQELAIPVIGTGRGRLKHSRKKLIALIAESFLKATEQRKITDKLVIVVRPSDASSFGVNLYDIKDHLNQVLNA